jgi:hypothetical protein
MQRAGSGDLPRLRAALRDQLQSYVDAAMNLADKRYRPGSEKIADRKDRFEGLLEFVTARNGWLTSVPGAQDVTLECLTESTLPDDIRSLGYHLTELPEGERILHSAIVQKFGSGPDGRLETLTTGSTRPVAMTLKHAGIVKVQRYEFEMHELDVSDNFFADV